MKPSKTEIFIFFLAGISLVGALYFAIYFYLRNDDWIDHDAKWKFVNYSTGYAYDGHTVELMHQYQNSHNFASIEGFTLPGRLAEEAYWDFKYPKGSKSKYVSQRR